MILRIFFIHGIMNNYFYKFSRLSFESLIHINLHYRISLEKAKDELGVINRGFSNGYAPQKSERTFDEYIKKTYPKM